MKTAPINNKLLIEGLEEKVEQHLKYTISTFQNLEEDVLTRPSATGGWSIVQCLQHLNTYGHYYLPLLKNSLQQADDATAEQEFKAGFLGNYFIKLVEPGSKTKKMKAHKVHIPQSNANTYEVIATFIHQQEILLGYLRSAKTKNLNRATIPVSIFRWIKLNPGDVFRFLITHNERYLQQAKRNL